MQNPHTLPRALGVGYKLESTLMALRREFVALIQALSRPGRIVGEMEQLRALYQEAYRLDVSDPHAAAMLRRKASRIGLSG